MDNASYARRRAREQQSSKHLNSRIRIKSNIFDLPPLPPTCYLRFSASTTGLLSYKSHSAKLHHNSKAYFEPQQASECMLRRCLVVADIC